MSKISLTNKTTTFGGTNARELIYCIKNMVLTAKSSWLLCFISQTHLLLPCGINWYREVHYPHQTSHSYSKLATNFNCHHLVSTPRPF